MPGRLALVNGRVYTQEPARPLAEGVAIVGNRIAHVGSTDDVLKMAGSGAERIELGGRAALPGFVDAHFHLLGYCHERHRLKLDGLRSVADVVALVREAAGKLSPDAWVLGRGWNRNLWPGAAFPTRHHLDAVSPDRPVMLLSRDVHAVWANSAALARAGITRDTPDPPGGRIVRDADGEPTGVLLEAAGGAVRALADRASVETSAELLRDGQWALNAVGITALVNFEGQQALQALQLVDDADGLTLRVSAGLTRDSLGGALEVGLRTGFGSERIRIGLLKLFADGALGSGTAAMLEPYEDSPDDRGIATLDRDELVDLTRRAWASGIGVAAHAIGDAAVRLVLDAAEIVRADDHPAARTQLLRVEHAQLVHPDDVPRFGRLGVVASMQPLHATSDMDVADRRWGARCRTAYAWRMLLDGGAQLAFGTDCPVEPPDPLRGIHAAVTRQRPNGAPPGGWYPAQRLTVAEAIHAYTLASAAAAGWEGDLGSLAPGKLADLVVLSRDPYAVPSAELLDTEIAMTVFDGQVVHER
ncbi:MAG: amidohydrolase [Chloroflexota bacterium]|nr:amidohydrolase [Chloroflexota bacterium]